MELLQEMVMNGRMKRCLNEQGECISGESHPCGLDA